MAATTSPSELERLHRFDLVERAAHWANAVLFGVLIATAACLYIGSLSAIVGRRELIRDIHVIAGVALPVPLLLAAIGRWGRGFRRDLSRLNRWTPDDVRWLRSWSPRQASSTPVRSSTPLSRAAPSCSCSRRARS
jgi:formate dehydrogenase subunit gamma